MTRTELATVLIAGYGAVLSTLLGVMQFVRGIRRVAVFCTISVAGFPDGPSEFIVVEAVNKGARPVTVTEAGLRISDGRFFTQAASKMGRKPLPTKLDFGEMVRICFDLPEARKTMEERLAAGVRLTAAFVRDAEGKEYTSALPKLLKGGILG